MEYLIATLLFTIALLAVVLLMLKRQKPAACKPTASEAGRKLAMRRWCKLRKRK